MTTCLKLFKISRLGVFCEHILAPLVNRKLQCGSDIPFLWRNAFIFLYRQLKYKGFLEILPPL